MQYPALIFGSLFVTTLAIGAQAQPVAASLPSILAGTGLVSTTGGAAVQALVVGVVVGTDDDAVTTSSTSTSGK